MKNVNKSLIVYICNHGFSYDAMKEARKVGARGGTIIHGRSSLSTEKQKFFGITLHPEKDLLLIVVKEEQRDIIMKVLCDRYGVTSEARGLCFSLKVTDAIGFSYEPIESVLEERNR
ncbi:MAG: hypothetical protein WC964_00825 [Acholeplasmataceae bacterium]